MQKAVMEHFCQIRGMAGDRDILLDVKMAIFGRQTPIACLTAKPGVINVPIRLV